MTSTSAALSGFLFGLSLIVAIGAQNAFLLRQGITRTHVTAVVAVCAGSDVLLIAAGIAGFGAVVRTVPEVLTAARWGGAAFLLGYGMLALRRALRPEALLPAQPPDSRAEEPLVPVGLAEHGPGGPPGTARVGSRPATGTARRGADDPSAPSAPVVPEAVASGAMPRAGKRVRGEPGLRVTVLTALALTWLNPHVYLDTVVLLGSFATTRAGEAKWALAAGAMTASVLWFAALGYGARLLAPLFRRPGAWRVLDSVIAAIMVALGAGLILGG